MNRTAQITPTSDMMTTYCARVRALLRSQSIAGATDGEVTRIFAASRLQIVRMASNRISPRGAAVFLAADHC